MYRYTHMTYFFRTVFSLILATFFGASFASAEFTTHRNLEYGPNRAQRMDIYQPPTARNAPVLVMVHGGAWRFGDKGNRSSVVQKRNYWTDKGYVFVSINYRMLPRANPYVQAQDTAAAINYIQENIAKYGGSLDQIIMMGHSAGAHLVALVHVDESLKNQFNVKPWQGSVLLDSAGYDIPAIMNNDPARLYVKAFGDDPNFWQKTSPIDVLKTSPMPIAMVCSTQRRTPCPTAKRFAAKSKRLGGSTMILPIQKSHLEINADLGKPSAYTKAVETWITKTLR